MTVTRVLIASLILLSAAPARAADDDADWATFGRIVALVHPMVRLALQSDDPRAVDRSIDSALAGENAEVNRLARDLAGEIFEGMPAGMRAQVQALALDAAALARRDRARAAERGEAVSAERSVLARKELTAMGLRYYDAAQFLDAVKRDDALAVELYVAGRGVNLAARDADGRSALEIARGSRNRAIVRLLEAAG